MNETRLKLIKGGRDGNLSTLYRFIDGEVTDTRLMGVLGMHLHFRFTGADPVEEIHQFWYFDMEEIGLDSLSFYVGEDPEAVELGLKSSFGGLGAKMVPVDEREARWLAHYFIEDTKRKKEELPLAVSEIDYVTQVPAELTPSEIEALMRRLCVEIRTDFGIINYYLMRLFGKDPKGAALLCHPDVRPEDLDEIAPRLHSTFLKNEIQIFTPSGGEESYLCESLIENDKGHSLIFSELRLKDGLVIYAKKNSEMHITESEASMKLTREEYVTVFDIVADDDTFDMDFAAHTVGATQSGYESGDMYMEFKKDNSHVETSRYSLNDDIQTLYFITDADQLLVAAYSLEAIQRAEIRLRTSLLWRDTRLVSKFHFTDALVFDYAMSGEPDFMEYLRSLNFEGE